MDANNRAANISTVKQELQSIATQQLVGKTNPLQAGIPSAYQPPAKLQVPQRSTAPKPQPQRTTRYICSGHTSRVTAVAWSPRGTHIASASYDKTVRVSHTSHGSSIITYRGHWDRVQAVSWSPDGTRIASAGDDGTVQVWHTATGQQILTYRGHSNAVNAVAWSPDGKRIASASEDKTVQVWDVSNGGLVFTYRGHTKKVLAVAWSPNSKRIATGGGDKNLEGWAPIKNNNNLLWTALPTPPPPFPSPRHSGPLDRVAW